MSLPFARWPARPSLVGGLLIAVLAVAGAAASGGLETPEPGASAASPVEALQEMSAPGAEHKWIARRAGTWKAMTRMRMSPDAPWSAFEATEVCKVVCGGFWLQCVYTCEFGGMPFEGRQCMGYDQQKKKYVSTWIDSFSSQLTVSQGTLDREKNLLVLEGETFDPTLGKNVAIRSEIRVESDDKAVMKMFTRPPDGKEYESMEIVYTRKK